MLTIHHLGRSQSERIVWLCEELGVDYELVRYERRADNRMAPPEYKALHPMGSAPVITDGELVLAESAAIVEYVIAVHGDGRLAVKRGASAFADYLYWFHFANGTFQPLVLRVRSLERVDPSENNAPLQLANAQFATALAMLERRLDAVDYLAGDAFTAADIMLVFTLTTMRDFKPYDLLPYPAIRTYLKRIGARPAYQRAMHRADGPAA